MLHPDVHWTSRKDRPRAVWFLRKVQKWWLNDRVRPRSNQMPKAKRSNSKVEYAWLRSLLQIVLHESDLNRVSIGEYRRRWQRNEEAESTWSCGMSWTMSPSSCVLPIAGLPFRDIRINGSALVVILLCAPCKIFCSLFGFILLLDVQFFPNGVAVC